MQKSRAIEMLSKIVSKNNLDIENIITNYFSQKTFKESLIDMLYKLFLKTEKK